MTPPDPDPYRKLNQHLRRRRLKNVSLWCLAAAIFVGAFWFIEVDRKQPVERVPGIVVGLHQTQDDVKHPTLFVVRLKTGQEVRVGGTSQLTYRPDRRVDVQIFESGLLGRRSYRFVRFLDAE